MENRYRPLNVNLKLMKTNNDKGLFLKNFINPRLFINSMLNAEKYVLVFIFIKSLILQSH